MPSLDQHTIRLINQLNGDDCALLLDADTETIKNLLTKPGKEIYVSPHIPKMYGKDADFVLCLSNEPIDIELYYKPNHGATLYKNIEAALSNCSPVLECLKESFSGIHFRVRTGCFNFLEVPYSVTKERVDGRDIFYIDLHSRFDMDNLSFLTQAVSNKVCEV
ncbi:MAG: hypothetical protein WAW33_02825 [Minisyncoccia bacterium]